MNINLIFCTLQICRSVVGVVVVITPLLTNFLFGDNQSYRYLSLHFWAVSLMYVHTAYLFAAT